MKNQTIKTTSEVKNLSSQLYFFVHITLTCVWKQKKKSEKIKEKYNIENYNSFNFLFLFLSSLFSGAKRKKYIGQNSSKYIKRNKD